MGRLRRRLLQAGLLAILVALLVLGRPAPEQARANPVCDVAGAPADAITGGVDAITGGMIGGNPVSDACNAVTDGVVGAATAPVVDALKGVSDGIFNQIAAWVADGAGWLMGRVVKAIDTSTSPRLDGKGFVRQYRKMTEIAVVLAAAMLLLAVLEGLAQGSAGMLARAAFVNLPLAFIGASVAFVVVQLLIGATDGLSQAISSSTGNDGKRFFEDAIKSLGAAGGAAGETIGNSTGASPVGGAIGGTTGSVEVPLFVTFLAAVIGAFAAFFVWIELLMRDAAIYAVALFVPLSLAASIWPRWSAALRRSAELMVVVIASKFVIVAIISLAARNAGQVEQILAAAALMLLASFAPFVLLRLVPFAEGAMAAAYSRRSAGGGVVGGMHLATQVQMMRNMARANWGGSGATGPRSGGRGGGSPGGGSGGPPRGGSGTAGGGGAAAGAGAGSAAAAAPAAAAAVPVAAAAGGKAAAGRLAGGASAQAASGKPSRETGPSTGAGGAAKTATPRPGTGSTEKRDRPVESPQPRPAGGGEAPGEGGRAPRPAPETSTAKREGAGRRE